MNESPRIPIIRLDEEQSSSKHFKDSENICRIEEHTSDSEEDRAEKEDARSCKKRLANFLNSCFIKEQWFTKKQKAITHISCSLDDDKRHLFDSNVPTIWIMAPCRPIEHEVHLFNVPRNLFTVLVHPRDN